MSDSDNPPAMLDKLGCILSLQQMKMRQGVTLKDVE
jgi:hypothetical protein